MQPLNVLSFGAGAIGTYIGGSLALAGNRVVFLERPGLADVLRQNGLRLRLLDGEKSIAAPLVVDSIDAALSNGPFDVAICAVKSFDTAGLLESLAPYRQDLPVFLSLQNGVENEPLIAGTLGEQRVIAGTVTTAIGRRGPGDIALERLRGVGVAAGHSLSDRIVAAFDAAGLNGRLYPNARAMKWSKLLTNLIANASSAILDLTPDAIFAHPGLFRLEVFQLREALAVMRALNIPVVDLPGTPVRLLALGANFLPLRLLQPLLRKAAGSGRGGKMPSFHIDLYSGRGQSEVGYLNGAVVRFGSQVGVPTPVNAILTDTLQALAAGEISIDTYAHRPEQFLARVRQVTG